MKAVMYGAGNIGRGFIGELFYQSGYEVVFIDVDKRVVNELNARRSYPVRVVSNSGYEETLVENVSAVDGSDVSAAAREIAQADVMATAVGVRALPKIIPVICEGLKLRLGKRPVKPLNIIICENLIGAHTLMRNSIEERLDEREKELARACVGFAEASIGRMVPVQRPEMQEGDRLRVCVERYGFLPVDKDGFVEPIPYVKDMLPFSPFNFYIERKLFVHNMGHAVCAYLGEYAKKELISGAIAHPAIRIITQNAMLESAAALSQRYGVPAGKMIYYIDDLIVRFANAALKDTCARVAADPARKLSASDRFMGAARLCLEECRTPVFICAGIAAALRKLLLEEGGGRSVISAEKKLAEISAAQSDNPICERTLEFYELFAQGASIEAVLAKTDECAKDSLNMIV